MISFFKKKEVIRYAVIQHSKEAHEMGIPTSWTGDFLKEIWIIKSDGNKDIRERVMDYDEDTIESLNMQGMKIFDETIDEDIPSGRLGEPLGKVMRGLLEIPKLIG